MRVKPPVLAERADYYSRYRPGLPLVLFGLALASCFFQFAAQWISRFADVRRVNACVNPGTHTANQDSLRDRARTAAYGEGAATSTERKRVKIPLRAGAGDDNVPRKNRPMLTVVVEGEQMTAVYDDGAGALTDAADPRSRRSEIPLDSSSIPQPQLLATWVPAVLRALAGRVVSRKLPPAPAAIEDIAAPVELAPPLRTASSASGIQRRKGQPRRK